MFSVRYSATFKKQFRKLPKNAQDRIKKHLFKLQEDPKKPRVGMDINTISGTNPQKHRIRIGETRIVYYVNDAENEVKLIEIFSRGRGYKKRYK